MMEGVAWRRLLWVGFGEGHTGAPDTDFQDFLVRRVEPG
jgi:hypothetical protein